jgi:dolichol-phosphate mannosyltransferase
MKITILIPTYNEAEGITRVVEKVEAVVGRIKSHEISIVVVDDSSPDGTGNIVKNLTLRYPNLGLFTNPKKVGLGAAYFAAMENVFKEKDVDAVMEFDSDMSHDPEKIPEMIEKLDEGYDFAVGSRYIPGGGIPDNWGILRKSLSVVGNIVAMVVFTNFRVRDWTGGFRVFKRWVYEKIKPHVKEVRNYTFQISTLYWAIRCGAKVVEVPFHFTDRTLGKSKMPKVEYIVSTLLYIVKVRLAEPEIKKFVKFGIVGFSGYLVSAISLWILGKGSLPEWLIWLLATEVSIISNFTWNNLWTFRDDMFTKVEDVIKKFIQFNVTSAGAIVIMTVMGTFLTSLFGSQYRQIYLPFIIVFLVLPYNWLMYTKVVWKGKKVKETESNRV